VKTALPVAAGFGWGIAVFATAHADGSIPPQPYHYLHPPAALAGSNSPPTSGHLAITVKSGTGHGGFAVSSDGQVGVVVPEGAFRVAASDRASVAHSIDIWMRPVDTPPGLPAHTDVVGARPVVADGNAYQVTALAQPGNLPVKLARKISLTLKWPHVPIGIDQYRNRRWHQLCNSDHAIITTPTISCPTATLGIFVVVTTPLNAGIHIPVTPVSSTPFAWLNSYIPLLGAIALVVTAIILGYFVTRPDKETGSGNSNS
jgi:hypothetical protein